MQPDPHAERALERVRKSMALAESRGVGVDLNMGWRAMDDLSLNIQAERFAVEDRDEADA